jgi:hypothetical protein
MVKQTTFRTTGCTGTIAMGLAVEEREWAQLQIQHVQMGIYNQGANWALVDRKLLRGNIRDEEDSG